MAEDAGNTTKQYSSPSVTPANQKLTRSRQAKLTTVNSNGVTSEASQTTIMTTTEISSKLVKTARPTAEKLLCQDMPQESSTGLAPVRPMSQPLANESTALTMHDLSSTGYREEEHEHDATAPGDKRSTLKVQMLDQNVDVCRNQQKPPTTKPTSSVSASNCCRPGIVAADTCRADVAILMDSRYAVGAVDVHNNVDGSNNDVASHQNNNKNNSNNFSGNAKRLDSSNIQHYAPKKTPENQVVLLEKESSRTNAVELLNPSTTSTQTTSSGSGNHQINNYKIHLQQRENQHQHQQQQQQEQELLRTWHSLSSDRIGMTFSDEGSPLRAGELASPRCHSRESNISGVAGDGRCPSNESQYSGNGSATPAPTSTPASPPVGLPLSATLGPAAAAALLPPQSAAMAAYFNAAAVAAQQNHLLLTNPLAAAASLVQQATQSQSSSDTQLAIGSPNNAPNDSILDFSTKRGRRESDASEEDDVVDEVKSENEDEDQEQSNGEAALVDTNSPLDLSLGGGRKRQSSSDGDDEEVLSQSSTRKIPRANDYKPIAPGVWVPPMNPYLAVVAAANLSPKNALSLDWNGKHQKIAPNEATKALEKMTEMTKLGSTTETDMMPLRHHAPSAVNTNSSSGRHSAWQSHWLNKGADAVKDVFKCVWCKQSFPTLASLTTHMKETQHCGVNVPPTPTGVSSANNSSHNNVHQTAQSPHHARLSQNVPTNASAAASSNKSDLNLLIKETMPLPRKLVRGQDVWLGKGAEQTRQILKCMWCGQSFRSLAEMTSHMQETQHYTNIISQEQIISWKSTDDKSSSGGSSNGPATSPSSSTPPGTTNTNPSASTALQLPSSSATVSAVLTCKVCDQAFASLKELSSHMVKNSHYKEHMTRSAGETSPNIPRGRGRQAREKRKKSLPVRKLLELERAQQDYKANSLDPALKPLRDFAASTKITCEKCGEKIETALFVDHIRQCLGGNIPMMPRNNCKTSYTPTAMPAERLTSPQTSSSRSNSRKTADDNISPIPIRADILSPVLKEGEKSTSTPSVLNAIEQLIEKSFDTRSRHGNSSFCGGNQSNTPLGSSILKRLGIDESVDYTKPLMDPQTMHFLRSYSAFSGRDRSASESSSVSERGSSRLESLTPERNSEISRQATPRCTPDRSGIPVEPSNERLMREQTPDMKIKAEPIDDQHSGVEKSAETAQKISVKKEFNMTEEDAVLHKKETDQEARRSMLTSGAHVHSPGVSERSITPKSNSSLGDKKLPSCGSSLNALSSMFDSLNNMGAPAVALTGTLTSVETNNNNVSGKKSNSNPLAALQKLCEKTDPPAANTRSNNSNTNLQPHPPNLQSNVATNGGGNGNMVAFSWACNDAVMTSDSNIKCSFCDTPFCSKGAYRHHLSKVHFVKDDVTDSPCSSSMAMKSPAPVPSPRSAASPKSSSKSPATHRQAASPSMMMQNTAGTSLTPTINPYDESPQSKFLKYTELAKQLSSKNV